MLGHVWRGKHNVERDLTAAGWVIPEVYERQTRNSSFTIPPIAWRVQFRGKDQSVVRIGNLSGIGVSFFLDVRPLRLLTESR